MPKNCLSNVWLILTYDGKNMSALHPVLDALQFLLKEQRDAERHPHDTGQEEEVSDEGKGFASTLVASGCDTNQEAGQQQY